MNRKLKPALLSNFNLKVKTSFGKIEIENGVLKLPKIPKVEIKLEKSQETGMVYGEMKISKGKVFFFSYHIDALKSVKPFMISDYFTSTFMEKTFKEIERELNKAVVDFEKYLIVMNLGNSMKEMIELYDFCQERIEKVKDKFENFKAKFYKNVFNLLIKEINKVK